MRWFEQQRLEFIQLTVQMCGNINREAIKKRFQVGTQTASKDLQTYIRNAKKWKMPQIKYNKSTKRYEKITKIEGQSS